MTLHIIILLGKVLTVSPKLKFAVEVFWIIYLEWTQKKRQSFLGVSNFHKFEIISTAICLILNLLNIGIPKIIYENFLSNLTGFTISACNFQFVKYPVKWNSLLLNSSWKLQTDFISNNLFIQTFEVVKELLIFMS